MEFYQQVFGGELTVNTFGEYGMEGMPADGIMHAQLETTAGYTIMAADQMPGADRVHGNDNTISLSGDDETELKGYWAKLSDGGNVTMPLEKQVWGDQFGMLTDKFGIDWMVNIGSGDAGGA
jgi:PhnB protein